MSKKFGDIEIASSTTSDDFLVGTRIVSPGIYKDYRYPIANITQYSGGGALNFTAMSGLTYTGGNKFKALSGSSAASIIVDATTGGIIHLYNTGSATTINLNGDSFAINPSGTNDGFTVIGVMISNGYYSYNVVLDAVLQAIPVPDVTAPTLVSTTLISAHVLRRVYSEAVTTASATLGNTFVIDSSTIVATGVSGTGTNTLDYTFAATFTSSSTGTDAYNSATGDIVDTAATPNALATYAAQAVSNTISSIIVLSDKVFNATVTPYTKLEVNTGTATIASDSGTNKLQLLNPNGSGDLARVILANAFTIGDLISITLTGVTTTGAAGLIVLDGSITTTILAGTNTYGPFNTAAYSSSDVFYQNGANAISTLFIAEAKITK